MSLASVQADLAARAPDLDVMVTDHSTATVQLAAHVHGVEPGQILCLTFTKAGAAEMAAAAMSSAAATACRSSTPTIAMCRCAAGICAAILSSCRPSSWGA